MSATSSFRDRKAWKSGLPSRRRIRSFGSGSAFSRPKATWRSDSRGRRASSPALRPPRPAAALFRKALQRDPEYALAHLNLGTALAKSGDLTGAREQLERAVGLDPRLAAGWNALGSARASLQDEAGALECWRRAVGLDPTQYDALYNMAIVEGRRGNREAARQSLQRFVKTAPPTLFGKERAEARRLLKSLGRASAKRDPEWVAGSRSSGLIDRSNKRIDD